MIKLVFERSIEEYKNNIKVVLSFGLLLLFVPFFLFFDQFLVASGTAFLLYYGSILAIIGLIIGAIFLYFFSFFITLIIYSVKRDVQNVRYEGFWNEAVKNNSIKIFLFYFLISFLVYVNSIVGLMFGLNDIFIFVNLIILILVMFVPQSLVLDDLHIVDAISNSIDFLKSNKKTCFVIFALRSIALFITMIVEFILNWFSLPGSFLSVIIVLLVITPFIEQMKSYAYVLKNDLIKSPEIHQTRIDKIKPIIKKINATRLREMPTKGKI